MPTTSCNDHFMFTQTIIIIFIVIITVLLLLLLLITFYVQMIHLSLTIRQIINSITFRSVTNIDQSNQHQPLHFLINASHPQGSRSYYNPFSPILTCFRNCHALLLSYTKYPSFHILHHPLFMILPGHLSSFLSPLSSIINILYIYP
jgi:hypothetical protein